MAGWLKAEFSTCRIALKAVIYRLFFYKSQKPRINRGAYIFFFSVCFSANKSNCWQFYEGRRYTLQRRRKVWKSGRRTLTEGSQWPKPKTYTQSKNGYNFCADTEAIRKQQIQVIEYFVSSKYSTYLNSNLLCLLWYSPRIWRS